MQKGSVHDSCLSSSDKLAMLSISNSKSIEENAVNDIREDELSNKNLFSGKDVTETITESEEESSSIEDKRAHSSGSSSKSDGNEAKMEQGRWTSKEHHLFLEGLIIYGNEWRMVQKHIHTRSSTQARSHAQKFFIKIRKQIMHETDREVIRNIIYEIFKKELKEQFDLKNPSLFLDKITTLVFAADNNTKKLLMPVHFNKSTSHESNHSPSSKQANQETGPFQSLAKMNSLSCSMKKKRKELQIPKETYFIIAKDEEKLLLKNKRPYTMEKESFTKSNKSYYENSSEATYHTQPSYINYVTLALDDNSKNSYIQNSINSYERKQQNRSDNKTNPFNLQFEELLSKTKNNSVYFGDNGNDNMNLPEDREYYNNEDSFSSFEM